MKLKFRCWDGETMISPDYVDRDGVAWWLKNSIITNSKEVMLWTGLLDKHGTEVYKGDICKVLFGEQELFYVCEWYDEIGAWVFRGNGEWLMWEDVFETCEIIGNIHQHPELMENNK